ncbi:PCM1 family protein [Megaselia abdita]
MPSTTKKKTGAIRKTASEEEKAQLNDCINSLISKYSLEVSREVPESNTTQRLGVIPVPGGPVTSSECKSESGGQENHNHNQKHHRQQSQSGVKSSTSSDLDKTLNLYLLNLLLKSEDKQKSQPPKMVKERTNSTNSGIYVNSTSLEDVAQSERSERAQSITSIHSTMERESVADSRSTPTPSYEDLHARLEASNRNIDNIRNQQQHLLRLQETAKKHLEEMDKVRNQAKVNGVSTTTPPIYESVEEVHNDMSSLVDRMKSLTTFIHGQHELSSMLGGDGDEEEMREQEKLLEKLNALRSHRDEMKSLITELNNVNMAAQTSPVSEVPTTVVEYERVVPIQLVGPGKPSSNQPITSTPKEERPVDSEKISQTEDEIAATNELIKQKMTDINSMKNQLKGLKDMMETIKLIEAKTGGSVKEIGIEIEDEEEQSTLRRSESTETVVSAETSAEASNDQPIANKVRLLTEVTNELRQQSMSLTNERDRIKGLKEEILRKKNEHENQAKINKDTELLRAEYEQQKKEFEKIVRRLNSQDDESATLRNESDGENEAPNPSVCKESVDSGTADINNQTSASLDATASFKSGSSRSYSMPPPMLPINSARENNRRFRKPSGTDNLSNYEGYVGNAVHQTLSSAPSTGPCYVYNTPYSPQFMGNNIGNTSASGDIAGFNFSLLNDQNQGQTISLQQLYQTQQLLINSITQCNNMIWQQQKEINQLNNVIISLQERLLIATEKSSYNRSESVPPHFNANRSQSEQPLNNYFHQQSLSRHHYHMQQQQQQQPPQPQQNRRQPNVINHHISLAENASEYDLEHHYPHHFNNQTHLNNDLPINIQQQQHQQQQHTPIFMNHHNNNIGATNTSNNHNNQLHANNISNLLAQQQQLNYMTRLNNVNSASNASQCNASSSNAPPSALNNQIVPGNRANNYLDNFRSYSRQNLLSSKSNEDHRHLSVPQQEHLVLRNINPFNAQRNNIQPPTLPPRNSRTQAYRNPKVNRNQLTTTPISLTSILQPAQENEVTSDFVAHARNMNFTFASNDQNKIPVKATYSMSSQSADFPGESRYNECERDSLVLVEGAVGGIDPEEMRRNLLVNAMKNDKFSTKFFESLKEDVYRQAYHLIQNQEPNGYGNEMAPQLSSQTINVDPLHEIFLNAINILSKNNNQKNEQIADGESPYDREADFEEDSSVNVLNYSNELCNNSNNYNHMKDDKKQPCKLPLEPLRNYQEKNMHGGIDPAGSMMSLQNDFCEVSFCV